jgi:hypothetical protein
VPRFRALVFCGAALGLCTVSDGFLYLTFQRQLGFSGGFLPLLYVATYPEDRWARQFVRCRLLPKPFLPHKLVALTHELLEPVKASFAFSGRAIAAVNVDPDDGEKALERSYAELALSDLVSAGEEVRIFGSGSSQELELRLPDDAEVGFSGGSATIAINNSTFSRPAPFACADRLRLEAGQECILAENSGGEIRFSVIPCTGRQ